MNKKTSAKVLKVTSVVLAVEAVVVLILLIIILLGKWPAGENVDNSAGSSNSMSQVYEESGSEYIVEESQAAQEGSQMKSDSDGSVTVQDEDRDGSAARETDESISNAGGDAESQSGTDDTVSQESLVVEEESIIQSNWGEIDWN